jgi:hypothetical protein
MKSTCVNPSIEGEIQTSFSTFRSRSKDRRYPDRLRDLCLKGRAAGIAASEVIRLAGISQSTMWKWERRAPSRRPKILEKQSNPEVQILDVVNQTDWQGSALGLGITLGHIRLDISIKR